MIAETYGDLAEAMVALECIKTYGKGTARIILNICHIADSQHRVQISTPTLFYLYSLTAAIANVAFLLMVG